MIQKGASNMITMFNSKSVFVGTSLQEFNEMREYLKQHGVKYKYKVNSQTGRRAGGGTLRGVHGSIGINMDHDKMYEIFIRTKDAKRLGL